MSRVLIVSFSDLGRDPRVDRQIGFLRAGHDVVAAGLGRPGDGDIEFIDLTPPVLARPAELARRALGLARLGTHRYEAVYWRNPGIRFAAAQLAGHGADVVLANDLSALPLACAVADGARIVFDAHELSTAEQADELWWRVLMAPYADWLLRAYLPRVTAMMTVAPGIAEIYESRYGVEAAVVTNAPGRVELEPTPVGEPMRMIHHGVADPQRRLELMIETTDLLDERFTLDLMLTRGSPRYYAQLEGMAATRARVNLIEPVGQREIVAHCNAYDIGIYLLPPRNENLLHALPNKIFEFIQARLAIVVGPSPEMAPESSAQQSAGWSRRTSRRLPWRRFWSGLTPDAVAQFKLRADAAAGQLNAERNGEIVRELVERASQTAPPGA